MLKIPWNSENNQLNMFWGFLRIFWKSGSRLKNPVLGPDVEQCLKYFETLRKHQLNTLWGILRIFLKSDSWLKIRFSAQMSNNAKKYHETLRKHQLNMFWGFLRNSWKSGSLLKNPVLCYRCRTMLKIPWNTEKTPPKHVLILNNLLAMVRCLGQPTLFIIVQMICTDQNWASC